MKHILIIVILALVSIAMAAESGGNATVSKAPKSGPAVKPAPAVKKAAPKVPKKVKSVDEDEKEEDE